VKSSQAKSRRRSRAGNHAYIASKFTHDEPETGRRYRLDNITSPSYLPNLVYEYMGYNPPHNGWAVSRAHGGDERLRAPLPSGEEEGQPVASLNQIVPSTVVGDAAYMPISSSGNIGIYSTVTTDVIIEIEG